MQSNSGFVKNIKPKRFSFEESQERIEAHKKKSNKRVNKRFDFETVD